MTEQEFENLAMVEVLTAWGFQQDLPKFFSPDGYRDSIVSETKKIERHASEEKYTSYPNIAR